MPGEWMNSLVVHMSEWCLIVVTCKEKLESREDKREQATALGWSKMQS